MKAELRVQLVKAVRGSVVMRVVSLAATLVGSVVLARALGPTNFGLYAYVFAIVTLLALPSQVGIPTLLVRETANAHLTEDWARLKGLWTWATRVILLIAVVVATIVIGIVFWNEDRLSVELRWTFATGLVLVPLIALGNARGSALQGLRFIVWGQLPEGVIRPLLLTAFVGVAWPTSGYVPASTAMAWHVLAASLAFVVGGMLLWHARPNGVSTAIGDFTRSGQWWRSAIPLALISALQVVGNQCGIIILGWFRPEAEAGLYKVATSAAALALFGMQTATVVIAPHLARLHTSGDRETLQRMTNIGAIMALAITIPVFLIFVMGGRELIVYAYGIDYVEVYVPLVILASGQMVNAMFGCVGVLLGMTGHEREAARWLAVSALVNIALCILLIPEFGTVGAAIASALSIATWNVAFWWIGMRRLGIDSSIVSTILRVLEAKRKPID
jgi:O-antigen/teichoic acid export membrane protein